MLERPNAHTRFAYEAVRAECERLGVALPADHEHAYNADTLRLEEEEYALADRLLCPSDFVLQTFLDEGFAPDQLVAPSATATTMCASTRPPSHASASTA